LTVFAASSKGANPDSLVGASGYKFNKADKKPIKLKLKLPVPGKKENGANGIMAYYSQLETPI
jgi:hypothetical protein